MTETIEELSKDYEKLLERRDLSHADKVELLLEFQINVLLKILDRLTII